MKLIHTSDWHLGRTLYGRSLFEDQKFFVEEFLRLVEREKPECVMISGDIYDRAVAPLEALSLFDAFLSSASELGVKLAVISGNHDGAGRMAIMRGALRKSGVYIATELSDMLTPVELEKGGERVRIFTLPFAEPVQMREYFGDNSLRGEAACMERAVEAMSESFLPGVKNVLMAHCFAAGALTSESESASFVGGSGEVPAKVFADFDYVALGHLHAPQRMAANVRYSGSPLKYSIDERNQKKAVLIIETEDFSVREEFLPKLRDVRRINGRFADLLEAGKSSPVEDYAEIVLEDGEPVLMAVPRLTPYYPRLLSLVNSRLQAPAADGAEKGAGKLEAGNRALLFSAFMHEVTGEKPDAAELELFLKTLEEQESGAEK